MYRSIVIGFDGTDRSRDAAALGVALGQATGASLTFVNAFYDIPDGLPDPLRGKLREHAEHELRELGREIPKDVAADRHLVPHHSPARALFELAEERDADLIVLGSSRWAPPGRMACGRLARQVVDGAPCAVAIAPAGLRAREDPRPRCIGVGVDEGPESARALVAAGQLARAFGVRLLLMSAVEPVVPLMSRYGFEAERLAEEEMQASAARALDRASQAAPNDVVVAQVKPEGETPALALAEAATTGGVDLLVVGARGFGPIRRVLLGSVSAELMRDLPCGLMVVPRGAREPGHTTAAAGDAVEAG